MDNKQTDDMILENIGGLVEEERALRDRGGALTAEERARLAELEVRLDQYWDLLRQRRAKVDAGDDPSTAVVRPAWEVESYES